ncbi:MAG TPA: hypothetical protein VE987_15450 [Polyangiaceae bacterium]|nr:hypothetical protein [Polyangiaceae bacterium]
MTLARFERRWAAAAMQAIFPGSREAGLADIQGMDVDGFLRELMTHLPFQAALGVRLAIWLVAVAPLFVIGRLATIAGVALEERERVLTALVASRVYAVRSLVLVLKTLGALLYAADERVRTRMMPPRSDVVALRGKRVHAA